MGISSIDRIFRAGLLALGIYAVLTIINNHRLRYSKRRRSALRKSIKKQSTREHKKLSHQQRYHPEALKTELVQLEQQLTQDWMDLKAWQQNELKKKQSDYVRRRSDGIVEVWNRVTKNWEMVSLKPTAPKVRVIGGDLEQEEKIRIIGKSRKDCQFCHIYRKDGIKVCADCGKLFFEGD